jgi:cell division protein FtsL
LTQSNGNKLLSVLKNKCQEFYREKLLTKSLLVTSWRMILFVSTLAVLVIYSSHKVDQKVFEISKLNEKLKDLRSRHIDMRTQLMSISKPTKVAEEVKEFGLIEALDAPFKIKVQD